MRKFSTLKERGHGRLDIFFNTPLHRVRCAECATYTLYCTVALLSCLASASLAVFYVQYAQTYQFLLSFIETILHSSLFRFFSHYFWISRI